MNNGLLNGLKWLKLAVLFQISVIYFAYYLQTVCDSAHLTYPQ